MKPRAHDVVEVVDEKGQVFRLQGAPLGRGGQGVVYRTNDRDIAVKFILPPQAQDPVEQGATAQERLYQRLTCAPPAPPAVEGPARARLRERLADLQTLPVPPALHLARPLSVLREHLGYTMQLLGGMVPILTLIAPPGTQDLRGFYLQGGGLRRRLELLAGAAEVLLQLHAIPLVYGDISPNNVFISETRAASEVWLIDADNLAFETGLGSAVFTPGYGAPEIVANRHGPTTLSDAWAFAVLAFQVLAQVHPFLGNYVEEGGWDDDEDREAQAFSGELPYVDDPDDDLNRTSHGLPLELVLERGLRGLLRAMFGPGRARRVERPGLGRLGDALRRAADYMLLCPSCQWTYHPNQKHRCPICEAPAPAFFFLQVSRFDPICDEGEADATDPSRGRPLRHVLFDIKREPSLVRRHVIAPVLPGEPDPPVLELALSLGQRLVIKPRGEDPLWLRQGSEEAWPLTDEKALPLPEGRHTLYLHCGPPDQPHRLIALRYFKAAS